MVGIEVQKLRESEPFYYGAASERTYSICRDGRDIEGFSKAFRSKTRAQDACDFLNAIYREGIAKGRRDACEDLADMAA